MTRAAARFTGIRRSVNRSVPRGGGWDRAQGHKVRWEGKVTALRCQGVSSTQRGVTAGGRRSVNRSVPR